MNIVNILICIVFLTGGVSAAFADDKGTEIAQSAYDRPDGDSVVTRTKFILHSESGQPRVRTFYSYRKDAFAGEKQSLIRFIDPADVRDTGLLTKDYENKDSDQWLYLPAMKSVRRIAGDRKGGRFVGSEVFYEDLQDRKVSADTHTFLRQEEIKGNLCNVIESVPVDPASSTYSKRVLWIHQGTNLPVQVDFYQFNQDEPVKRLIVNRIDKVDGYWTVMESEIRDLKQGQKTVISIEKIVYDTQIPDDLFTQTVLEDPAREMKWRP